MSPSPVFLGGARGIKAESGSSAAAQLAALGRGWWLQTPGAPAPQAGVLSPMLFNVNCFSLLSKHASHLFPSFHAGKPLEFHSALTHEATTHSPPEPSPSALRRLHPAPAGCEHLVHNTECTGTARASRSSACVHTTAEKYITKQSS